jgi:methylglutaconyl-CoA hydratase
MNAATELCFRELPGAYGETVALLALDRPGAANAFNDAVIKELVAALAVVRARPGCRALILRGKGKHFSAGADLGWMKASAKLSFEDNRRDAEGLIELFESLATLPLPTIALVHGSAFGGAVGLTACCDIAIAAQSARFCLSEIRLGLMPAVIVPYLARRMRPGDLRRLALTARPFGADEALAAGLVQRVVGDDELEAAARAELELLLQGAPEAQTDLKILLQRVVEEGLRQGPHTAEAIAKLRAGPTGQAGLSAFFDKKPAPWAVKLAAEWSLDER